MTNQQLFIRKAVKLSIENVQAGKGGPFASLIVKGDNIIATGTNCVVSANDPTAHAEIIAIREACKVLGTFHLNECEIYTSCEPCPMCLRAIYWARLFHVYFACTQKDVEEAGFNDTLIYTEITKPMGERIIPMVHLPQNDALLAFKAWKEKADKVKY